MLKNVTRGVQQTPFRGVVYGRPGVGKTTFAAGSPAPVFLGAEDGTKQLDVARFPLATSLEEIETSVLELTVEEHPFRTLVIDTLDSIEPLVHAAAHKRSGSRAPSFAEIPYGAGPALACEVWRQVLAKLDRLSAVRGMAIVLIAHAHRKTQQDPAGEAYEKQTLRLAEKTNGMILGWADAVLYATTDDSFRGKRQVAVGPRELVCQQQPGLDAKSRYPLSETVPMTWVSIEAVCPSQSETCDPVIRELLSIATDRPKALRWLSEGRSVDEMVAYITAKRRVQS